MSSLCPWIDRHGLRTVAMAVALWCAGAMLPTLPASENSAEASDLADVVKQAFRETRDGWSADEVVLKDSLNAAFLRRCQQLLPGADETQLNRVLLNLRKARKLRPELVTRVADWGRQIISLPAKRIVSDGSIVPTNPGVYIFRDTSGYLYIGESANLRTRVTKHLDRSDRESLAHYLWDKGIEDVTVELHAFDPDSNARFKEMRRAYESELIRSRKPRFNIAP